jgi:hypothetical protein
VRTKDSCWSVRTIYDPRELPGVSTVGPEIRRGVTAMAQPGWPMACKRLVVLHPFLNFSIDAPMVHLFKLIDLFLELLICY